MSAAWAPPVSLHRSTHAPPMCRSRRSLSSSRKEVHLSLLGCHESAKTSSLMKAAPPASKRTSSLERPIVQTRLMDPTLQHAVTADGKVTNAESDDTFFLPIQRRRFGFVGGPVQLSIPVNLDRAIAGMSDRNVNRSICCFGFFPARRLDRRSSRCPPSIASVHVHQKRLNRIARLWCSVASSHPRRVAPDPRA